MVDGNLQVALELTELGAELLAQRHRREQPEATDEDVERVVADWYADRRHAPDGDAVGRVVPWPRSG